jgi:hypothetical protein
MKKIALVLSLLAFSIAVILLSGTVAAAIPGRHCVTRSLLVLDADQVVEFAVRIDADGAAGGAAGGGIGVRPIPVPGKHCVMRSLLVLDTEQVVDFAIRADGKPAPAAGAAPIPIARGQTVGDVDSNAMHQTPMWGLICLMGTIGFIVNILFWVLAIVFLVLTIIGVFIIMTAAGDANKVKKGKNYIVYAIVGLVASLFVRAVPAMIRFMVGM